MNGIFISTEKDLTAVLSEMDRVTIEWTMRAARGETGWICADCCCTFPEGMPDSCVHGHKSCTDIIQRDKRHASIER